ncbi:MAG: PriCT-2 domain-containing protein, partial [Cytophagales bacterium]|nr:PriCT-2 domain-containing protein [Cytophagales bacterium]
MKKKEFDPSDWVNKPIETNKTQIANSNIEKLAQVIESRKIDITSTYENWLKVGFALADGFKEEGRGYFHRLSQFYQGYTAKETNKQFDYCLKARKQGITLKSLFHLAKEHGIIIGIKTQDETQVSSISSSPSENLSRQDGRAGMRSQPIRLPTFPESLFPQLPEFLQKVVKVADSNEERDILLLGSIVSLSACLHKVYGIYDGKKAFPNLFLFITAQASAGKGRLVHCKQLV